MSLALNRKRPRERTTPEELHRGIEQFNRGAFQECYQTLQFIALHEARQEKNLYQGIVQLAMGLQNWQEEDYRVMMHQLRTAIQMLQNVAPACMRVDVAGLISQTESFRKQLEALGMTRMKDINAEAFPKIRMSLSRRNNPAPTLVADSGQTPN